MKTSTHYIYFILFFALLFIGCSDEKTPPYADISGVVKNIYGQPLEGVLVYPRFKPEQKQYTDDKGNYQFTVDAPATDGMLMIEKEGFYLLTIEYNCLPGEKITLKETFLLPISKEPDPEKPEEPEEPDHFLTIHLADTTKVNLYSGSLSFRVETSAQSCITSTMANWLTIDSYQYDKTFQFTISYNQNETNNMRRAMIVFTTKTALKDTIWLEQSGLPFLQAIDYSGKDKQMTPVNEMPFIKFNRKVKIISITNAKTSNLIYEEDSTLVRVPDIDVIPYSNIDYIYIAESEDGQRIQGYINVVPPYFSKTAFDQVIFTNQDRYCWTLTNYSDYYTLSKYNTSDNSLVYSANFSGWYGRMCYNEYNNSIYVYKDYITVINAETHASKELALPAAIKSEEIISMDFGYNGWGLFQTGDLFYSIDATQNHDMQPYQSDIELYNYPDEMGWQYIDGSKLRFTSIEALNNRKQLLLYRSNYCEDIFVVDVDSRKIESIYNRSATESGFSIRCLTHRKEPYVTITTSINAKLLNIQSKEVTDLYYDPLVLLMCPLKDERYLAFSNGKLCTINRRTWEQKQISAYSFYSVRVSDAEEYMLLTNDFTYLARTQDFFN